MEVELWLNWINLSPDFLSRFVKVSLIFGDVDVVCFVVITMLLVRYTGITLGRAEPQVFFNRFLGKAANRRLKSRNCQKNGLLEFWPKK